MPLTKREVSPVYVSRGTIPDGIRRDELQCCANGTLTNLIRQLASISKHAENIFGEIYLDAMKLEHKTSTLQQRMERLSTRIAQLDTDTEQASLEELQMRKQFKSSCLIDQHTLDRSTLPNALERCYERCDPPPNLNALNPYRESAVPALSLYTNPSFFFDLWRREMLKDCGEGRRRMRSPTNNSPRKKKNRPPQQDQMPITQQHQRQQQRYLSSLRQAPMGVLSFPEEYQAPQALGLQLGALSARDQPLPPPPESLVPPMGMSMPAQLTNQVNSHTGRTPPRQLPTQDLSMLNIDDEDDELPPPPPATIMQTSIVQQLSAPPQDNIILVPVQENQVAAVPPPPPPPPPPLPPAGSLNPAPTSFTVTKREENGANNNSAPKPIDTRNNLLAEIQSGIKLKKVQRQEEEAAARAAQESNDVAAILKRRMESVMGKGDEESHSEDSDGEWDDD